MFYVESTKPSYFSGEGKCCGGEGEEEDAGQSCRVDMQSTQRKIMILNTVIKIKGELCCVD